MCPPSAATTPSPAERAREVNGAAGARISKPPYPQVPFGGVFRRRPMGLLAPVVSPLSECNINAEPVERIHAHLRRRMGKPLPRMGSTRNEVPWPISLGSPGGDG